MHQETVPGTATHTLRALAESNGTQSGAPAHRGEDEDLERGEVGELEVRRRFVRRRPRQLPLLEPGRTPWPRHVRESARTRGAGDIP